MDLLDTDWRRAKSHQAGRKGLMGQPPVSTTELSKVYEPTPGWMRMLVRSPARESVVALVDVSFEVLAGQICAIIGPNGAGKSTLFRILTGLTTPTGGTARVLGMDPVTDAHRIRRYVGFMPAEDRTLFLRHTCRENLHFHGRLQGMESQTLKRRTDEMLDLVGLWEARDRTGFALSSGMRARLMFARALLHRPRILILDEPTGSIDPVAALELLERIQEISLERRIATLISSHRLEEIEALRDNVMLLDRGRNVYWGDLQTVRDQWKRTQYEIEFSDPVTREEAYRRLLGIDGSDIELTGDCGLRLLTDVEAGVVLRRLPTLGSVRSLSQTPLPLRDLIRLMLAESNARMDSP